MAAHGDHAPGLNFGGLSMSLMEITRSASRDDEGISVARLRGYSAVAALIVTVSAGYVALGSLIHSIVEKL